MSVYPVTLTEQFRFRLKARKKRPREASDIAWLCEDLQKCTTASHWAGANIFRREYGASGSGLTIASFHSPATIRQDALSMIREE